MSRTIRIKLYKFSELSEDAKQKALDNERYSDREYFWQEENRQTLEAFAEIFPIKIRGWSYGGRGEGVSFYFTADDQIEELSGQRLATYIWNNYRGEIYSQKYYSLKKLGLTDSRLIHKRVTSKQITSNCPNKGKWSNSYHSALNVYETYNCPLTGYCMDNEILDEIWKFIDKPDKRDFKDLLEDCFNSWIKACNNDVEYQNSDEYLIEEFSSREVEFTADGKEYLG